MSKPMGCTESSDYGITELAHLWAIQPRAEQSGPVYRTTSVCAACGAQLYEEHRTDGGRLIRARMTTPEGKAVQWRSDPDGRASECSTNQYIQAGEA